MTNTTSPTHALLTAPLAQPKRPRKTSALLLGTALGAIVGMGYGRGAYAQTFTIDSEETIQNGGETLDGGDTLAITSSGSLEIDTDQAPYAAVTGTGGGNTVTNAGRISVTTTGVGSFTTSYGDAYDGSGGQGVVLAGGNSRVTNDGQIVITSTDGEDNGFNSGVTLSDLDGAEVLNGGSISITASASSGTSYAAYNHAVYGYAPSNVNGVVIRNEGDIDIQVNGSGFDTGRNRAIRLVGAYNDTTGSYDGTFTNMTVANDGAIRITANDGGNRGVFISGNGDNIDLRNTGLIDIDAGVFGSNGAAGNRGFQFSGVDGYMRVENSGRIEISTNGGGNRGLFHDGVRDIYLINSGSIDIDIRDGTGGGNRGIQVSPQQGGTATVINSGSISIDTGSGGNRGVMLAFGYANSPYVLNSGRIVITGAAPKGVFAYGTGLDADYNVVGGEALVVNTGYIAINASAYGQGIELKDYSYEADTRVVNRGRIIVSGGSGTHGIEVVAGGDGNTATVTNSGTIISSYHSIELDNYSGAAGVINLEAGSVLVGDIEIANHDTATINFGPGLNAIVRMEDVTEGSDVPAQINVTDGEYVVEGDTIYVASNQSFAAVDTGRVIQNTGRVILNERPLTLDALAANTSGASFTPEVTRGSARVRNLGWGTFFGRRSDGDGVTRDVNTRGIMVGAELGETIGIFFGAANSTFGADSEANH